MNSVESQIKSICNESPGQMSYNERLFIYNTILSTNCKNLLVFGAGNDSELWSKCSQNTVVVEHDREWLDSISSRYITTPGLKFYSAKYKLFDTRQQCVDAINEKNIEALQVHIDGFDPFDVDWDCIIVDGPTGYRDSREFYRSGSIKLACDLTENKSKCKVFVHDVDRLIESKSIEMFFPGRMMYNLERTMLLQQ